MLTKISRKAIWLSKLIVISCCLQLSSCDEDEHFKPIEENANNAETSPSINTEASPLIGTWKYTDSNGEWATFEFNQDGSGKKTNYDRYYNSYTYSYYYKTSSYDYKYTYDSGRLYIYKIDEDGNFPYSVDEYNIIIDTANNVILLDDSSYLYVYKKQ